RPTWRHGGAESRQIVRGERQRRCVDQRRGPEIHLHIRRPAGERAERERLGQQRREIVAAREWRLGYWRRRRRRRGWRCRTRRLPPPYPGGRAAAVGGGGGWGGGGWGRRHGSAVGGRGVGDPNCGGALAVWLC